MSCPYSINLIRWMVLEVYIEKGYVVEKGYSDNW